jgi:hypothetical protein
MQKWYVRCRSWSDLADEDPSSWRMFAVDEVTGAPSEYLGPPEDALRQLEDDLRGAITSETQVHREPSGLVLVHDDESGDRYSVEYRLVDAQRPVPRTVASPRPPSSGRLSVDRTGLVPNRFLAEFQDVAGQVPVDLSTTLAHLDPGVGLRVGELLLEALEMAENDIEEAAGYVMTTLLWFFMVGREHALRGYQEPVIRENAARAVEIVIAQLLAMNDPKPSQRSGADERNVAASGGFRSEIAEISEDVIIDYQHTLLDLDEEVGRNVMQFVVELLSIEGGQDPETSDPGRVIAHLLSGVLWMFRLGRAHAQEGYASPVPRGGGGSRLPDTVEDLFGGA